MEALPTSRSGLVSGTHPLEAQDPGVGGSPPPRGGGAEAAELRPLGGGAEVPELSHLEVELRIRSPAPEVGRRLVRSG